MRRILAWAGVAVLGMLAAGAAPLQALAQQAPPAEATAKVEPGRLGVHLRELTPQLVKALGLTQAHAILVESSVPGGPADRIGLRRGDVILELDGTPVAPFGAFIEALQRVGAGNVATLGILRGKERLTVRATLAKAVDIPQGADAAERRIEDAEALLRMFDRETFAQEWAQSQLSLGVAYWHRIRGDRADNLEKAIAAYQAALTVLTREAHPEAWAQVQQNLGVVYNTHRIRGDLADHIEKAVAAFEAALAVRTREGSPRQWSEIQYNLGVSFLNSYMNRLRGDPADNQEKAIAAFEASLTVRTREAYPREWAATQRVLASVYGERHRGDRADNQEKAIAALEATLTVWTSEAAPQEWFWTQMALATRYETRIRGDRADNLEKVIAAYEAALTVRTREAMPREWADTQAHLAGAYLARIRGDRAENLEKAIAAYELALTVRTREATPGEWQSTQTSLGNAYRARIRGDRADNLKKAAAAYALAANQGYAMAQDRLGLMHQNGHGVPQDYARAIDLYRKAAAQGYAYAMANLGWIFANGLGVARDYQEAAKWYRAAAEKDVAWAQNNLAWLYRNGHGVELNYEEALNWSRRAAALGDATGMFDVGWHYDNGRGTARDLDEAFLWFRRAVDKGSRRGMFHLGWAYEFGRGVVRNWTEAAGWYERAGEKGEVDAQERLGVLYLRTSFGSRSEEEKHLNDRVARLEQEGAEPYRGSPYSFIGKSHALAVKWLKMAADGGSASAMVRLANVFAAPQSVGAKESVERDLPNAVELYTRAAKGELAALFNLGALYELGLGVPRDLAKATTLYRQAHEIAPHGAALALARVETGDRWKTEIDRRAAHVFGPELVASLSPLEHEAPPRILLEAVDPQGFDVDIKDELGRRLVNASLARGQAIEVPQHTIPLILWSRHLGEGKPPLRDRVRISVGGKAVTLPADLVGDGGIYLDAAKLLSGESLAVDNDRGNYSEGPDFIPVSVRRNSRIVLQLVNAGEIYVRDDHFLVDYEPSEAKAYVPNIPGLKLEVRSRNSSGDPIDTVYDLYVDGKNALRVRSVPNCVLSVDLDAERLRTVKASAIIADPETCEVKGSTRDRSVAITATDGTPLARLSRIEDDEFPSKGVPGLPVIAKFIPINYVVSAHLQRVAGRLDEAKRGFQLGLTGSLRLFGPNSPRVADILQTLAEIELEEGNYDSARQKIERAVAILEPLRGVGALDATKPYRVFAKTLLDMGRPGEAERFALKGYLQSNKRGSGELGWEELADLARVYRQLRQPHLEKLLLLRAMLHKQVAAPEAPGARAASGEIPGIRPTDLLRLSRLYENEGKNELARHILEVAHREAKFQAGAEGLPEPLKHPLDLSRFEHSLGPIDSSLIAAESFEGLADTYTELGRSAEALPLLERAVRIRKKVLGGEHASVSSNLHLMTRAHLALGEQSKALATIREAASSVAKVRKVRSRPGVRGFGLAAEPNALAATYAHIALKISEADAQGADELASEVFNIVQIISDTRADEAIQKVGERFGQSDPNLREQLRQRQDLEERLGAIDRILLRSTSSPAEKRDPEAEGKLRDELGRLDRAIADVDQDRKTRFPQYARLIETAALDRQDAARLLSPDEALVSFVVGDRESFVIALTQDSLYLKPLDVGRRKLERMVETLRCGLDVSRWLVADQRQSCRDLVGGAPPFVAEAVLPFRLDVAHDLYRLLLGPVEEVIRGRHLLIVPSGPLTSLPMHVLVTRPPKDALIDRPRDYRDVAWLAKSSATTVLPSVASLRVLRAYTRRASRAPEPYVAFANPLLVGSDPKNEDRRAWEALSCPAALTKFSVRVARLPVRGRDLVTGAPAHANAIRLQPPLPETAVEVCDVAARLKAGTSAVHLGGQAREATVKSLSHSGRLARYRVVHFATHGIMAGEFDGNIEPALVMTPPAKSSQADDGLLTASEVAQLRLNADWVILSACNTAAGDNIEAEALSGLARAFFHAGARGLLVSHWYVDSLATVRLTTGAFQAMADEGRRKRPLGGAHALQQAMLNMILDEKRPDYRHPAFWAPFVVVGEGGARS